MNILVQQVNELCQSISNPISLLANVSAALNMSLKDINWVGFYVIDSNKLILGPFQGNVACTQIDIGKGVCGTSYLKKMLLNVNDVHTFPGHIACDSRTNSEIVVPLIHNGKQFGVLDIDSLSFSRFSYDDEVMLQEIADIISARLFDII